MNIIIDELLLIYLLFAKIHYFWDIVELFLNFAFTLNLAKVRVDRNEQGGRDWRLLGYGLGRECFWYFQLKMQGFMHFIV